MTVAQVRDRLTAFIEGRAALDQVVYALDTCLARHRGDAPALRDLLEEALGRGLEAAAFDRLIARLALGADAHDEQERTRILPGGTAGRSRAKPPTPRDATRIMPGGTVGHTGSDASAPGVSAHPPRAASGAAPAPATPEFRPGDVLKDRFRLVETLGVGGMGVVWKAVDKLKEEARDRNPYVAVKLLTGDFRHHPEALIALQRESAKQQRLAHPNIATVFDFDRDGDTVYMTMEVMHGLPMDRFLRELPRGGLPWRDARPIIEELGAGLAYAHQAGLVHSDLKPGNAFITSDRHVKLLDFGIARASKTVASAEAGTEGETTVFDPRQLGALTPAYATVEMFDGMDPDPRDDIFALAIIAYQLLSGRHPYDRKAAPKAMEARMTPAPVARLNRRQNRALRRGLAFPRGERTASVAEFLDGLRVQRSSRAWMAAAAIAAVVVIGVLAYTPVVEHLRERERERIIAVFDAGDQQRVEQGMALLAALEDPSQRKAVMADPRTRTAIIDAHVERRRQRFDPAAGHWDHAGAVVVMDALVALYPDSAEVLRLRTELEEQHDTVLGELAERYGALLAAGRLADDPRADDVTDVRDLVARIDPGHALLDDPQLLPRYREVAAAHVAAGRHQQARDVVAAGRTLFGDDAQLMALHSEAGAALARAAAARRIVALEAELSGDLPATLAAFDARRAAMVELDALDPLHPLLDRIRAALVPAFGHAFAGLLRAGNFERGYRRLVEYAVLLTPGAVREHRAALAGRVEASAFDVEARATHLAALLAQATFGPLWESRTRSAWQELLAVAGASSPAVLDAGERLRTLYAEQVAIARAGGRFDEALALLDRAQQLSARGEALDGEREDVLAARQAIWEREAEARREARIDELKRALLGHAQARRVAEARALLEELRGELPEDDAFLVDGAPGLIAAAYLRRARAAMGRGDAETALAEASAGLELAPLHAELLAAHGRYGAAIKALEVQELSPVAGPSPAADAPAAAADGDDSSAVPGAPWTFEAPGASPLPAAPATDSPSGSKLPSPDTASGGEQAPQTGDGAATGVAGTVSGADAGLP